MYGANVVIFEGILAFANKELLKVRLQVTGGVALTAPWVLSLKGGGRLSSV